MDLKPDAELAQRMFSMFGDGAIQMASDNAHFESIACDDAGAARWRRVMVLIMDCVACGPDALSAELGGEKPSHVPMLGLTAV